MKRLAWLGLAAATALVASSVAVAHLKAGNVAAASATFSAPTAAQTQTRTYNCDGDTIEVSHGTYTGTATSTTTDLNGPIELRVHSVYNTTKKLGWVDGWLKVRAADNRSRANFTAVNVDGKLDGWLRGTAGHRDGLLFGSLTASFNRATGFAEGMIGTGSSTNAALLTKRTSCRGADQKPSVRLLVRGEVETVSSSSISVKPGDGSATQTCTVTSDSPKLDKIEKGDKVEMQCVQVSGVLVLTRIHERR